LLEYIKLLIIHQDRMLQRPSGRAQFLFD